MRILIGGIPQIWFYDLRAYEPQPNDCEGKVLIFLDLCDQKPQQPNSVQLHWLFMQAVEWPNFINFSWYACNLFFWILGHQPDKFSHTHLKSDLVQDLCTGKHLLNTTIFGGYVNRESKIVHILKGRVEVRSIRITSVADNTIKQVKTIFSGQGSLQYGITGEKCS